MRIFGWAQSLNQYGRKRMRTLNFLKCIVTLVTLFLALPLSVAFANQAETPALKATLQLKDGAAPMSPEEGNALRQICSEISSKDALGLSPDPEFCSKLKTLKTESSLIENARHHYPHVYYGNICWAYGQWVWLTHPLPYRSTCTMWINTYWGPRAVIGVVEIFR